MGWRDRLMRQVRAWWRESDSAPGWCLRVSQAPDETVAQAVARTARAQGLPPQVPPKGISGKGSLPRAFDSEKPLPPHRYPLRARLQTDNSRLRQLPWRQTGWQDQRINPCGRLAGPLNCCPPRTGLTPPQYSDAQFHGDNNKRSIRTSPPAIPPSPANLELKPLPAAQALRQGLTKKPRPAPSGKARSLRYPQSRTTPPSPGRPPARHQPPASTPPAAAPTAGSQEISESASERPDTGLPLRNPNPVQG